MCFGIHLLELKYEFENKLYALFEPSSIGVVPQSYLLELSQRQTGQDFEKFVTVWIAFSTGQLTQRLQVQAAEVMAPVFYLEAMV
jgi:hypothetical protein